MNVNEKLEKYFKDNGIQKKWFAQNLGISLSQFSQIAIKGKSPIPIKYWRKIMELTKGEITFYDLLQSKLKFISDDLICEEIKAKDKCVVKFKENVS